MRLKALEAHMFNLETQLASERAAGSRCAELLAERRREVNVQGKHFQKAKRVWQQELAMHLKDQAEFSFQVEGVRASTELLRHSRVQRDQSPSHYSHSSKDTASVHRF